MCVLLAAAVGDGIRMQLLSKLLLVVLLVAVLENGRHPAAAATIATIAAAAGVGGPVWLHPPTHRHTHPPTPPDHAIHLRHLLLHRVERHLVASSRSSSSSSSSHMYFQICTGARILVTTAPTRRC
jgi:hypothetical protein